MAAAEARAAWQRAANRCFVQEDAKRAPKLSPPPPPPCSSMHTDTNSNTNNTSNTGHQINSQLHTHHESDDHHQLIFNLTPLNWSPYLVATANLPPDTRWWLQLHPNFAYQREFLLYEPKSHMSLHPSTTDPLRPSTDFEFDFDQTDPLKTSHCMSFVKNTGSIEKIVEDRKLRFDVKSLEDPLMPKKREREPWWRVADGDELASMVAQKTAQHVENCDLPKPTQALSYSSTNVGMVAFGDAYLDSACDNDSTFSRKIFHIEDLSDNSLQSSPCPLYSDNELHVECATRFRSVQENSEKKGKASSREELLEALCHSQTRARVAELAAKKVMNEKEDIMKLLFKQASHLFACKQWLKMLQLENLCLQLRIRDHHIPLPFNSNSNSKLPVPPPHLASRNKSSRGCNSICRYVIVFAVGWGLASAGLLLGWTFGWLLPKL